MSGEGGAALCAGLCPPLTSAAAPGRCGAGGGGSGGEGGMSPESGMLLPRRCAGSGGFLRPRRLLLLLLLLLPRPPPPAPPHGPSRGAEPPPSPHRAPAAPGMGVWGGRGRCGRSGEDEARQRAGRGRGQPWDRPLSARLRTPDRAQAPGRGPGAAPNPGCLHHQPPDHPCPPVLRGGGCPLLLDPSCPAEPPPLPWARGDLRGAQEGVPHHGGAAPPNSPPQSSASPAWALGPGGTCPARGTEGLGEDQGEPCTHNHEQPQGQCRGHPQQEP